MNRPRDSCETTANRTDSLSVVVTHDSCNGHGAHFLSLGSLKASVPEPNQVSCQWAVFH
jgi:hypothetical protein